MMSCSSTPLTYPPWGFFHFVVDLRAVASESDVAFLIQASMDAGLQSFVPTFEKRVTDPNAFENVAPPIAPTTASHHSVVSPLVVRRPHTSPAAVKSQIGMGDLRAVLPQAPSSQANSPTSSAGNSFQRPAPSRQQAAGIISITSEDDIMALAEILAPAVDVDDNFVAEFMPPPPPSRAASHHGFLIAALSQAYPSDQFMASRRSVATTASTDTTTSPSSDSYLHYEEYTDGNYLTASPSTLGSFQLSRQSRQRYLSDTPSLATTASYSTASLSTPPLSRTPSFQQLSSPISPSASSFLPTPIEPPAQSSLGVIHEGLWSEELLSAHKPISRANAAQGPPPFSIEEFHPTTELKDATAQERRGHPHLEIQTSSPDTLLQNVKSHTSPSNSSDPSPYPSPQPSAKGGAFSRFFRGKHSDPQSASSGGATFNDSKLEAKLAKEETKRVQKEAAKERRERLAREFQAKADAKAAADAQSLSSSEGRRNKAPTWEEEGADFGSSAAWA